MRREELNRIIRILKGIREVDDDEIKDCALASLIEMLEDIEHKQESFETNKSGRNRKDVE